MENLTVNISIMSAGDRTVAEASLFDFDLQYVTGAGSAGREPGDKPDQTVGDNLATARALRSLAARLERRANGKVKHAESVKAHKTEIAERKAEAEAAERAGRLDYAAGAIERLFSPPHGI